MYSMLMVRMLPQIRVCSDSAAQGARKWKIQTESDAIALLEETLVQNKQAS